MSNAASSSPLQDLSGALTRVVAGVSQSVVAIHSHQLRSEQSICLKDNQQEPILNIAQLYITNGTFGSLETIYRTFFF